MLIRRVGKMFYKKRRHVCFMANGEEMSKVNLETSLDKDDLTMDELARFF